MIDWIIAVMNEMGELYAWDVMNEAVHNSAAVSDNIYDFLKDTPFRAVTSSAQLLRPQGVSTK